VEPPDWAQSMRLYLGNAYLQANRPQAAETACREEFDRFPDSAWALNGLSLSLAAQSKHEEAAVARARFTDAWRFSDTELTAAVF
jgi:predicted Zn-dependent protease